jgi:hypothetical protein
MIVLGRHVLQFKVKAEVFKICSWSYNCLSPFCIVEYIASSRCLLQSRVASESELLDVLFPGNTWQHILASTRTSAFHHDECTEGCRSPTCPSRQICTIDNEYQWIVLINAAKLIQGPNQTDNEKHFALHACDWWGSSRRSNFSRSLQKLDVSMWKHVNSDVKTIAVLFEVVTLDTPVPCS